MKAFPNGITTNKDGLFVGGQQGMDLRDYFATHAMLGILTMLEGGNEGLITVQKSTSKHAYELADAMMKAREQK